MKSVELTALVGGKVIFQYIQMLQAGVQLPILVVQHNPAGVTFFDCRKRGLIFYRDFYQSIRRSGSAAEISYDLFATGLFCCEYRLLPLQFPIDYPDYSTTKFLTQAAIRAIASAQLCQHERLLAAVEFDTKRSWEIRNNCLSPSFSAFRC